MRRLIARLIGDKGAGRAEETIADAAQQTEGCAGNAPEDFAYRRQAFGWWLPKIGVSKNFTMAHTGYRPEAEQT